MPTRKYLQENRLLTLLIKKRNEPETNLLVTLLSSRLDWQYILDAAREEGIFYPAYHELSALDTKNKFFAADTRDKFKQLYYAYISQSILLSQQISLILDKIEAKGIKTLVLKGPAIDALIYKEDYLRPRLDLDLAVKKEDFLVLENLLFGLGYYFDAEKESLYPIPEYLNSRLYTHKQSNFISVHAHRHIINNLYLMVLGKIPVDMERVWQEAINYKEYNYVFCLKPELQLLYTCEHALKHDFERLIFFYEIERLVDSLRERINWDKLVLLAQELELSFALYYGLYFMVWESIKLSQPLKLHKEVLNPAFGGMKFLVKDILSADVPEGVLTRLRPAKFTLGEKFFIRCTLKKKRIKYLSYLVYLSQHKGLFKKAKFVFKTIFPPNFNLRNCVIRVKRLIQQ